jgi:hypothetical protein
MDPQTLPGQPARGLSVNDAAVAQYAAVAGIDFTESRLRLNAMQQICSEFMSTLRDMVPQRVDRLAMFGVEELAGTEIEARMNQVSQLAILLVNLLTDPAAEGFDRQVHAKMVASAFGQTGWMPGGDFDSSAVPITWWATPLGRVCGRVLRGLT